MDTSSGSQPTSREACSSEHAARVIVRAEKYFLCTACGTLVEIPADVVGQVVTTIARSPSEKPAASAEPLEEQASSSEVKRSESPQPKRCRQPKQAQPAGEVIDGLRVPSSRELDRAVAWGSFRLKVLDRQGSEVHRLRRLLKQQKGPCVRSHGRVREVDGQGSVVFAGAVMQRHAHKDESMAPGNSPSTSPTQERGPP
ncbi:hypothetical protein AB1K70_12640 [Bremerella sp. JC770]|uniref:hypothetical protein n=1 Tax=Bremerella sp. JC770 TaxID=3232137 RepID=UPI00345A734C